MPGRGHVFDSTSKLQEMFSLRCMGSGPSDLGRHYGVDHSTINYHLKRAGYSFVRGQTMIQTSTIQISMSQHIPQLTDLHDGSPINQGRNYAEYVEQRKKRDDEAFWAKVNNSRTR